MKDYTWLAVFSVFTLVVGFLFTYGSGTRADTVIPPIQVFVTSTSTPSSPIIIRGEAPSPQFAPPVITVNVMVATSSLFASPQVLGTSTTKEKSPSYTYHITNNTYENNTETDSTTEENIEAITLTIQGVYEATTTPIENGETILELLTRLDSTDPQLDLTTEDYGDMGILVTGMGGYVSGTDGNYWQYQVNGTMPMIGADQYELTDGETVLWEFKGF